MDNLERIEFSDGSWWLIRTRLSHGASRAVSDIARRHFTPPENSSAEAVLSGALEVDWGSLELEDLNSTLVLHSTTEWSYGPVTAEVFAGIPEDHYQQALKRVNELYVDSYPLVSSSKSDSQRSYSPPSPSKNGSQWSGWMLTFFKRLVGVRNHSMP